MKEKMKRYILMTLAIVGGLCNMAAQEFFNLTASQVRIDSMLPTFTYQKQLGAHYADSTYEVTIEYPEFIDMSKTDIARLRAITTQPLPEMPKINQLVAVSRKEGMLDISFVPLVMRDGKYQKLVSFQLSVKAKAVMNARKAGSNTSLEPRYASHSVLASGQWAKIRVKETGVHQLTNDLIRRAGFSNPEKVKIYGYGGARQPEALSDAYLRETDDLHEVPTYTVGNRRLFFAIGPVNWENATTTTRERNNYSQYGYYFLTESDGEPLKQDSATFVSSFYPHPNDYHALYEPEEYAWFQGGRNLYSKTLLNDLSNGLSCTLESPATSAKLSVALTFDNKGEATVLVNDSVVGQINTVASDRDEHSKAALTTKTFNVSNLNIGKNTITVKQTSGATTNMRLDYAMLTFPTPYELADLKSGSLPVPEYVYNITNQDLHAHDAIDMLIIIPLSLKLQEQAERIKALHEEKDGMRVRILPADELYNEFSSGTPDANAYRRYLKMLYDRATTKVDMPSYLLLLGDCAWDNRMLTTEWRNASPDDYLLCYESENSFSQTKCYVSDDYFTLLDDDEGMQELSPSSVVATSYRGKPDVAVGRLTARNSNEAKVMIDKIESYINNEHPGAWQNTLCFMGDDGNNNMHMDDAESIVNIVMNNFSSYNIKKVYWDAYTRVSTSTGNGYPDVTRILLQQMKDGALIMNYTGHGGTYCISHEKVLWRTDFEENVTKHLPLWVTASCEIMPFDGQEENIGESAMHNKNGGAVAFFGTTRTVFTTQNRVINRAFMKYVLGVDKNGKRISIGEAARLAKNEMVELESDLSENKLQYSLLGDPALVLATPTITAKIDSINGKHISAGTQRLVAGQEVTVSGHIPGYDNFNGVVTASVRDVEETIICKMNNLQETDTAFRFKDRPSTIYIGNDSVRNGRFSFTFAVPKDIRYSDDEGLILVYAVNNDKTLEAHGEQGSFIMSSTKEDGNDGIGPSIYCYLNSSNFTNGGKVNSTPYFFAEITDKDGINAAGSGIGHDLELIIDGELNRTYNLNNYFEYNFGDYRSGTVGYSIPELTQGTHKLLFRAWDVLNNSSTAELTFVVDPQLEPSGITVVCTKNPASSATSFVISHDRTGSQIDVTLEVFDTSGRKLWEQTESGIPTGQTYVVNWDLNVGSGSQLRTGVYLYRVVVSSNGSSKATQAKKLIVLGNN